MVFGCTLTMMHTTQITKSATCFGSPGITMTWNWKMPSTLRSWHWRYIVCFEIPKTLESILTVSVSLFLLPVIYTCVCVCVSGEFWGSDDRGEHWSGHLQRGWFQKTHPSRGERLPGSHCVNTASMVKGLSGHISWQRHNCTAASSLRTQFFVNHTVWLHYVMPICYCPDKTWVD